jgi:hypothetical protein
LAKAAKKRSQTAVTLRARYQYSPRSSTTLPSG